jgi:hypothetical protein
VAPHCDTARLVRNMDCLGSAPEPEWLNSVPTASFGNPEFPTA